MAGRARPRRVRGFWYDWGPKKKTPEAGQARLYIVKDGSTVLSFNDDGRDTSGDSSGVQSKLNQTGDGTTSVYGLQVSPRFASGVGGNTISAIQAESILKGTNVLSGDYRGIEVLMDDSGSGNTVAGDVVAFRVFSQLNVNPSGHFAVMEVEAQGDTGAWDYFLKLPNDSSMAWTALTSATESGAIKVRVGTADRYIALYTKVPD